MSDDYKTIGVHLAQPLLGSVEGAAKSKRVKTSAFVRQLVEDWHSRETGTENNETALNRTNTNALVEIAETFCSPALADRLKACVDKYLDTDQRMLIERLIDALCEAFDDYGKVAGYCPYKVMPQMQYNDLCKEMNDIVGIAKSMIENVETDSTDPLDEDTVSRIKDGLDEVKDMSLPYTIDEELEIYHKSLQARLLGTKRPKSPQK